MPADDPMCILCHIMSQHFRLYTGIFKCVLPLVIEWRQSQYFLSNVTGNIKQEKRLGPHQI